MIAVASVILLEVSFRAIITIANQLEGTRFALSDDTYGIIFCTFWTVSLVAMNYGLYTYCPLMHPVAQVVVSVASTVGYTVFGRKAIFGRY